MVESVRRLEGLIPPERVLVITGRSLQAATRELLPWIPEANLLAEPRPASTGPALAWATTVAAERDSTATVLSLHADWFVGDDAAFRATAERALDVAERFDVLVAVGVAPDRADVGYGYIQPGEVLEGDARRVAQFIEKPDAGRAGELVRRGALWNSGLFAWTARRFLAETAELAPEIAPHLSRLHQHDLEGFYASVQPVAVDLSHFERSQRVAVIPGRFPWDDVGTWSALARVRRPDGAGNTVVGEVASVNATGCVAWAADGPVVLYDVRDLVVVRANGVVLVTSREGAARLKDLFPSLPRNLRDLPE